MKKLFGVIVLLFGAAQASAENMYIGADTGLLLIDYSESYDGLYSYEDDSYITALRLTFGGKVSDHFAIEGYLGLEVTDARIELDYDGFGGDTFSLSLDQMYGVNFVGIMPLGRVVELYGKVGFVSLAYEDDYDIEYDESGLALGFGIKFNTGSVGAVTIDYSVLPDAKFEDTTPFGSFEAEVESSFLAVGYQFYL